MKKILLSIFFISIVSILLIGQINWKGWKDNDFYIPGACYTDSISVGEYTFPSTDGTSGYVLKTDGNGNLLWQADAGGGSGSPGGVDGQVQYNNSGVFGGASGLYYDDVNDRVGIGTTTPESELDIKGSVHVNTGTTAWTLVDVEKGADDGVAFVRFVPNGVIDNTNTYFYNGIYKGSKVNRYDILIYDVTNDTIKSLLSVKASGEVGIGTADPKQELHVASNSGNAIIRLDTDWNVGRVWEVVSDGIRGSFDLKDLDEDKVRVSVDSLGNVGIGTTTPLGRLHVVAPELDTSAVFSDGAWSTMFISHGSNNEVLFSTPNNNQKYVFRSVNDTLIVIKGTGEVGIGTTNPVSALEVVGAITQDTIQVQSSSDSVSVANCNVVAVRTSGGDVTIGAFADGHVGQVIYVYNDDRVHNIIFEDDEGTGNQDIKTSSGSDVIITADGGATFVFDGTYWNMIGCAQ